MTKLIFVVVLAAILLLSWTINQSETISADAKEPLYMVLIDKHASSASQEHKDLTASFIGLLSSFKEGQSIGFISAGDEEAVGPAISGSAEHKTAYKEVISRLDDPSPSYTTDLSASLAHAFELMKFEGADEGSTLYVVSGGELEGETPAHSAPLDHIIRNFNAEGWQIVSVALPGSSPYASQFMNSVSSGTGSDLFPLSNAKELKVIADSILSQDARGTLFEIGKDELAPNDVFTASLDIAPSTTESSIVFFRQGNTGSLSLKNPSGIEAYESDRALSSVVQTPFVVVWTLVDPAPGKWSIDVSGGEGFISAWHYPKNRLNLHFVSFDTVPFDQSAELVAYIASDQKRVSVPGSHLRATITNNTSGQTYTYTLNDNGELGDAVAGDAYYSTTVPPLGAQGEYQIELELYWPEYDHTIYTRKAVTAQEFPAVDVNLTHTEALVLGERVKIGTAEVHINGQPYAIPVDKLSAHVSSDTGSSVVKLVPQNPLTTGHAWMFDIIFTPTNEELHTLILHLNMEYASREYTYTADSVVLSSIIPPMPPPQPAAVQPAPPVVVIQPPAPPVQQPQPPVVIPPPPPPVPESALPIEIVVYGVTAIAAVLIIAGGIYIIHALTRPKPYGFLYDDQGNLLVNLSNMHRSAVAVLTSKNLIRGEELDIPELSGLSLLFKSNEVNIRSGQTEPSIRINNSPLIEGEETSAGEQSWIGTQGKLFNLQLLKAPMMAASISAQPIVAPVVGDD